MAILVVCRGCRSRFQVSDKFAGKSGACPKCKAVIHVPTKEEEVKIHGATELASGGRHAAVQLVIKPIARKEVRLEPVAAVAIVAAALATLLVTWVAGRVIQQSPMVRIVGLLLVSLPMVIGGYAFLRDDELEPYRGMSLYIRAAICSAAYVGLWGVYGYVAQRALTGDLWNWFFVAPPFLVLGALTALACLDLDFGSGFFHYCFYLLLTILLRWAAGMGWLWQLPK